MTVKLANVVQGDGIVGKEAAVKGEVFLADERGEREGGKGFGKDSEDALGILGLALALEAVHAVHVIGLVITAVEQDGGWM